MKERLLILLAGPTMLERMRVARSMVDLLQSSFCIHLVYHIT